MNGSYWTSKGLEIKGAADNGVYVAGNNNRLENLDVTTIGIQGYSLVDMPPQLLQRVACKQLNIVNTYSHDNFDPDNGEDADGFAAKLTVGPGNVFDGCISVLQHR